MRLFQRRRYFRSHLRWWWQRRRHGFDEREIWDLDYTIISFIHPRLKYFRANYAGIPCHPTELNEYGNPRDLTKEEWEGILDEMLEGFQIALEHENIYPPLFEDRKKLERSLDLLREWFFALWT